MPVRLHLLGSPAVESEDGMSALAFERRSQLVAFLALRRAWVGRAELAALLWPGQSGKLAHANLRKTLFRIQSLPWAGAVETRGGALRFAADTDVLAFESALREERTGDALALHHGELLAGFDDAVNQPWSDWLSYERERLRTAWRGAALRHLAGEIEAREAIELSARLLEADPLDEAALLAHMAGLARDGQAARARQVYQAFTARLAAELGVAPGAPLQALHDELAGRAVRIPSPPGDDGFVGRSVELRQLAALLARGDCRLVTVIGPGGVGKTRFAQRALADLAPAHAAGAAFVALEDARGADGIVGTIALELGVALKRGRDPFEQLADFLRERPMLLVLDNFEHLAAEAALLERLLAACPGVKFIVTTRARLGIAREQLLPLDGLPCPDAEDHDRLESFDATRLFVKAARRLEPAFVPDAEAASLAEICRLVEGLPLALELAAAWTRVMSCEAIAVQLREGTHLLHATDASRPARHASMEVVFDGSWRLLGAAERDALARVSIFQGGFTAEAARAVAGASFPVLGALVDKSLLRKEDGRLHLHPLLHGLAAERLERSSAAEPTHRAHAQHFFRLMTRLARDIERGDREALGAMDAECHNCHAAWRWALAHEPVAEQVTRAVPTLLHFSDHRLRIEEGLALLREAIDALATRGDRVLGPLLLASAAHLEYRMDRYARAIEDAERALPSTDPAVHQETRLQCFKVLGGCSLRLGRLEEARRNFERALEEAPADVDPGNAAAMLDNLSLVAKYLGDYSEALRLSHESLVQHRFLADPAGEALCLNNLGSMLLGRGDHASARTHLADALALCERHGLVQTQALVVANLAELALLAGDLDAAEGHARRALEAAEASGQRAVVSALRIKTCEIALRRGDTEAARGELAAAMQLAIAIHRPALQFEGIVAFADILIAQKESAAAARVLAFLAGHAEASAPARDLARERLASLPPGTGGGAPAAIALAELANRIVAERDVGHRPLVAALVEAEGA
jgi:predicted ATPase/DNA-binding SARP family transcriptional activator/Tfp pilus assembly protein PilF